MGCWIFELEEEHQTEITSTSSSSSSSIGKDSDSLSPESSDEHRDDAGEEEEVQSAYNAKQGFLDSLEEALPIRKGLSEFYGGRSKSFACLEEAAGFASVEQIGKAENAYNRRHRNVMAYKLRNKGTAVLGGGVSKKAASASRKLSCLSRCESICSSDSDLSCNFVHLRSRASSSNLVSLKQIGASPACRKSRSCPDFSSYLD